MHLALKGLGFASRNLVKNPRSTLTNFNFNNFIHNNSKKNDSNLNYRIQVLEQSM